MARRLHLIGKRGLRLLLRHATLRQCSLLERNAPLRDCARDICRIGIDNAHARLLCRCLRLCTDDGTSGRRCRQGGIVVIDPIICHPES
ncbi:hypothetical protein LMG919_14605, partial [Xanthomonas vesicatoria]